MKKYVVEEKKTNKNIENQTVRPHLFGKCVWSEKHIK